jgi:hypothetical protein
MRVQTGMSTMDQQATMTIAASVADGRFVGSQGRNRMSAATASAPTTPTSCVRPPAASATGVREALLLTEKPWKKPVAMLAAPSASSS